MQKPKILKRTINEAVKESREKDMETVLDNYRENLKNHGVTNDEVIDRFVAEEKGKMQKEYESLDNGDCSSNTYHSPTDWESIASKMKDEEKEEDNDMSM